MHGIEDKYIIKSTTDKNGIIDTVSEAFCVINGYTSEELIGSTHSIIRHPDTPSEIFSEIWKTIKSGNIWIGQMKNKKKDGSAYYADTSIEPIFDENGAINGYKSIRFDITDKIRLQMQNDEIISLLKRYENEIKSKNLIFNSQQSIVVVHDNGRLVDVNTVFLKDYGYKNLFDFQEKHECICELFINDESKSYLMPFIEGVDWLSYVNEHKEMIHEVMMIDKDNRVRVYSVSVSSSTFDTDLNDIGIRDDITVRDVIVFHDITEIKRSKDLLISQTKQAAMGEMISMIAHQWKQPLTAISAIHMKIKIKQTMGQLTFDELLSELDKAKDIIRHLTSTIGIFQNFFKKKDGNTIKIVDVYKSINTILLPIFQANSIRNELYLDGKEDLVDDRLDQVLLNIYQNANDALLDIESKDRYLTTNIYSENEKLVITICNRGKGIEEAILSKIFLPYYSTKSKNGTGIGLYMSKVIVEDRLRGSLSAYNTAEGVCFKIVLPKIR